MDDETVKKDIESWPFKIVDHEGAPGVQVEYLNETKTFSPQEISAMVLGKVSFPEKKNFLPLCDENPTAMLTTECR